LICLAKLPDGGCTLRSVRHLTEAVLNKTPSPSRTVRKQKETASANCRSSQLGPFGVCLGQNLSQTTIFTALLQFLEVGEKLVSLVICESDDADSL
jgi:hypothetical protein